MTGIKIDLHTHSAASDGTDAPLALALKAREAGIQVLDLTDHDTAAGVRELLGKVPEGLTLISGIEVSARTASGKCHILGLGCDLDAPAFTALLDHAAALRREKLERRIAFMRELGLGIPEEEYEALRAIPSAGKPHLGALLVKYGHAPDLRTAIRDVVDRCPPFPDRVDAGEAIPAIRAAGGVAVWAHPMGEEGKRPLTVEEFRRMLEELLEVGVMGMECWYSRYPVERCEDLEKIAAARGLLISGGSDCHGERKNIPLGRLNAGGVPVDPARLTVLKRFSL